MPKYQSRNFKKQYELGKYSALYRNSLLSRLKAQRPPADRLSPFTLDFGPVTFRIARHFGFCKGVENAIEVAYETLALHPDRNVYMISELIHNSFVNADLMDRGLRFIKTAKGEQLIPWSEIRARDIVITPAFGATQEDKHLLEDKGVKLQKWDATCRFVENVWFRARELGNQGYSIIIHGKYKHEETQATRSHSEEHGPTVVVKNMKEAQILGEIILGKRPMEDFDRYFREKASPNFDPEKDLERLAVVNQTTMLATETASISAYFKKVMIARYGLEEADYRVANTRDTLCYATKNNQGATLRLLEEPADVAIVIGGRNSSNTSHLVELCQQKLPTYFIASEKDILSSEQILHFDFEAQQEEVITHFLPQKKHLNILLTSGASCPDAIVERVLFRLLDFFQEVNSLEEVLERHALVGIKA